MTPTQHTPSAPDPEALRLANILAQKIPSIQCLLRAAAELRRQHNRIEALQAELEAVGAGGVQALAACAPVAPTVEGAIAQLKTALRDSKGWAKNYSDALIRDAIDRVEPAPQPAAPQGNGDMLRAHAEGRVTHINNGLCPDIIEGHDTRDPECPVCQALLENHAALPAPPQGAAKGGGNG